MNFLKKSKLIVVDFISGDTRVVEKMPFIIGGKLGADWKVSSIYGELANKVEFSQTGSSFVVSPQNLDQIPVLLNGEAFEQGIELKNGDQHILKIGMHLLGITSSSSPKKFLGHTNFKPWTLFDGLSSKELGNTSFSKLVVLAHKSGLPWENMATKPTNFGSGGFWLRDLHDLIRKPTRQEHAPPKPEASQPKAQPQPSAAVDSTPVESAPVEQAASVPEQKAIPSDRGEFQCPICWLQFDGRYIKHISSHPSDIGDSILGADQQRRFTPVEWDGYGVPLDAYNQPSPDIACPHCHHRLPAGFGEFEQFIFSIVGAPSSGKSYYLAILIKTLKRHLFKNFDLTLMDQDPEFNTNINDVIRKLYSAKTVEEFRVVKTDREGGTNYQTIHRGGHEVTLPVPSIFNLSKTRVENTDSCLVFYDNAGEHFLPAFSKAEDYHILHVAKASALFFLYDPLVNIDLRKDLKVSDSELLEAAEKTGDLQTSILSQMNVKISRALGKQTSKRLDVPFAMMIGKCDMWHSVVQDFGMIRNPVGDNHLLDLSVVDSNSEIMRNFMNEYAADVVATVERISSNVRYFPMSSLGHRPRGYDVKIKDDSGKETTVREIHPDPEKISPYLIEVPTEWAISQVMPELINAT